jgi:fructoselysine-6-P-deglycase FrlB-like protein
MYTRYTSMLLASCALIASLHELQILNQNLSKEAEHLAQEIATVKTENASRYEALERIYTHIHTHAYLYICIYIDV